MHHSTMRASDADRNRIAELLQEQTAQGRLTLEEFSDRVGEASVATTNGQLDQLVVDLPIALPNSPEAQAVQSEIQPSRVAEVAGRICGLPLVCLVLVLVLVLLA